MVKFSKNLANFVKFTLQKKKKSFLGWKNIFFLLEIKHWPLLEKKQREKYINMQCMFILKETCWLLFYGNCNKFSYCHKILTRIWVWRIIIIFSLLEGSAMHNDVSHPYLIDWKPIWSFSRSKTIKWSCFWTLPKMLNPMMVAGTMARQYILD